MSSVIINKKQGLNEVQRSLLRVFDRPMSNQESVDLQTHIMQFYREQLDSQVMKDIQRKGITDKDIDARLKQNNRTHKGK